MKTTKKENHCPRLDSSHLLVVAIVTVVWSRFHLNGTPRILHPCLESHFDCTPCMQPSLLIMFPHSFLPPDVRFSQLSSAIAVSIDSLTDLLNITQILPLHPSPPLVRTRPSSPPVWFPPISGSIVPEAVFPNTRQSVASGPIAPTIPDLPGLVHRTSSLLTQLVRKRLSTVVPEGPQP